LIRAIFPLMAARIIRKLAVGIAGVGIALVAFLAPPSTAGEPPDQRAVVGQPFRPSKSVLEYCGMKPPPMMCTQALPLLASMSSEARDAAWAARMEALIEKFTRVDGRKWVGIRALECRSTLCALEYAVDVGDLDHEFDGNAELERLMDPIGGIVAPELGPDRRGGRMVSIMIWKKRQ
jgi:hypothetical protein